MAKARKEETYQNFEEVKNTLDFGQVLESTEQGTDRNVFAGESIFITIFDDELAFIVVPLVSRGTTPILSSEGGLLLDFHLDLHWY